MGINGKSIKEILRNIDPYDFEFLIAKIWEEYGWKTKVTSGSQDRGIDVIARQDEPIPLTIAIQAKAYSQTNKIGSGDVRKYKTLYDQEEGLNAVSIATTGQFTDQAKELAEELEINLLNLDDITSLVASIDVITFASIVSPINSETYDLVDIPYPSSKNGCPECNTSGTLWEADLEDDNRVMVCDCCDATWKAKSEGSWILVNDR